MKISHKLCVRMDGTQFLLLWWFTAKNEGGNHIIAWVYIEKLLQILWALVLCKDAVYCKKTDVRSYLFKLYPIRLSIGDTFPTLHICSSKVTTLTVPVEDCIKLFCIVFLYHSLPPKSSLRNQVGLTLSDLDCLCSLSK